MRIADRIVYDNTNANLGKNRTDMAELQNQAATQKRVNRPSDDPLAATRVLATRTEINGAQQYLKNINTARGFLEYSDQSLSELGDVINRAKEIAINQSNDASASAHTREVTATEIKQLYNQTVQIGNRKLGDRFLFGGYRTTRPPFDPEGNYSGDNGEMEIIINKDAKVAMNIPGSRVFLGMDAKAPAHAGPEEPPQGFDNRAPKSKADIDAEELDTKIRGPASTRNEDRPQVDEQGNPLEKPKNLSETWSGDGVNVFRLLSNLEISMRTNDKEGIQGSLNELDTALAQVVKSRSQLGSKVGTLNSATESLTKTQYDAKTMASNLEDVDSFELVNNLNKSENTLKASLATSSKLIQPSLLDFLR